MIVGAPLTIALSVTVNGSRRRVFAAMTDPEQVAGWWGPKGFTCPEVKLDVRVGGVYRARTYMGMPSVTDSPGVGNNIATPRVESGALNY